METKQGIERLEYPTVNMLACAQDAYAQNVREGKGNPMRAALEAVFFNWPILSQAPELLEALEALTSAFMSHTQWNGTPPVEIINARAIISKAKS